MLKCVDHAEGAVSGDLAKRIGAAMREARKRKGLRLIDVAERCGTTPQSIQRLETATMALSADWIERICAALGIDADGLFNNDSRVAELATQMDAMREEVEAMRLRAVQFITRMDDFLEATGK